MLMSGAALRQALLFHLATYPHLSGGYPHLSDGLHLIYDVVACTINALTLRGVPIDDDMEYRVATSSFIAAGGDGNVAWTQGCIVFESPTSIETLVSAYVESLRLVDYNAVGDRLVLVDPSVRTNDDGLN